MGRYLAIYLGVPCVLALLYVAIYLGWRDSVHFYLFWLGESYIFPIFPVVALVVWRVHWGKRHPLLYLLLTLLLLIGATWIGTEDAKKDFGEVKQKKLHPLGVVEGDVLTADGTYEVLYFPYDEKRLLKCIRERETINAWVVEKKSLIVAFVEPEFASYKVMERLMDLGTALFVFIVFAVFYWVTMRIWWRDIEVGKNEVRIRNWRQPTSHIPLNDVIHIHLDKTEEDIRIETEEMVYNFPYDVEGAREVVAAAERTGLTPLLGGERWIRDVQCEELRIEKECLICLGDKGWTVPYRKVFLLSWDSLIQIELDDDTVHTITDRRYLDQAWYEELASRVTACWEEMKLQYTTRVEPDTGVVVHSLCDDEG